MSRIVFTNMDEFLRWIKKHCTPAQYEVYVTSYPEIIVAPTKSTRRLRYTYIEMRPHWNDVEAAKKSLQTSFPNGSIYMVDKFDWDLSRIVFDNTEQFLKWSTEHANPSQYEVYITSYAEIILAPTKSTRNLRYAHMEIYPHWDSMDQAVNEIKATLPSVEMYHIKKFDWDSARDVGVKQVA